MQMHRWVFLWVTFKIKSVDIKSKSGKLLKYSARLHQWKSHFEWGMRDSESYLTLYSSVSLNHHKEIWSRCCINCDTWGKSTAHWPSNVNFYMWWFKSIMLCGKRMNAVDWARICSLLTVSIRSFLNFPLK